MRLIRLCGALLAAPAILAGQISRRTIEFTTTEGTWMSPDVARDGRTIVFDVVGELYTVPRAGGSATPIVTGPDFASQPRFSPDGRAILFVSDRDGSDNLWTAAADGSSARQLTHLPRSVRISPLWDSLRGHVVYQHGGSWQGIRTQIYLYDDADLTVAVLTNSGTANPAIIATDIATVLDSSLAPDGGLTRLIARPVSAAADR